jgi:acetolactate synthase-1/2/3 large subunit
MTQKNYFDGTYYGCDTKSGLGFPDWVLFFKSYSVPVIEISTGYENNPEFLNAFNSDHVYAFIVKIDPEQTYYPKIASRITESGSMESSPIHLMFPDLDAETEAVVFKYL